MIRLACACVWLCGAQPQAPLRWAKRLAMLEDWSPAEQRARRRPRARTAWTAFVDRDAKRARFAGLPTVGGVTADAAFAWANASAPFVDLPTLPSVERAYYYRWKLFREHVLATGCARAPWVLTECRLATTRAANETGDDGDLLPVDGTDGCVWGDALGVIAAASGHHVAEGRWLRDARPVASYVRYLTRADPADAARACGAPHDERAKPAR